jgi:FAD/FMN-containing dehydrogenase
MPLDDLTDPRLKARLRRELEGEVMFDRFSRGRYATDASIYQIEPLGVVVPRGREDVATALQIAREEGVPVLPRGGGTSQCGQTVARALVLDCSKYMDGVVALDVAARRIRVQPGVVLERMNASLRRHKLFYPVDVSTGDRATIGGMTANNSCGARSIRYGNMVHNVPRWPAISARTIRLGRPRPSATATWCATCARFIAARPTRSRPAFPRCSAGSAATTST